MNMPILDDLQLDKHAPGSLVAQLQEEILRRVRTGALRPGDRLPPSRQLADILGVNRGTVTAAYEALRERGILDGQVGRGTFVAETGPAGITYPASHVGPGRAGAARFRWQDHFAGFEPPPEERTLREAAAAAGRDVISFAGGVPDPSLFPTDAFRKALDRVLREEGSALLAYGAPEGHRGFLDFLKRYLAGRDVATRDDELLVVNGSQQAVDLLARAFLRPGDTVVVEEPSYYGAIEIFQGYGARLVGVPVDGEGIRVDAAEAVLARERPKLLYVMPTFQNPTGGCLSSTRREALVRLCARFEVPVVEDDFDGELYFDQPPPPPLKSLSGSDGVIYIGTPSKMLFPGLRIGWIAAAAPVVARLARIRRLADLSGSPLLQAALAGFAASGALDRHMKVVREAYGERVRKLTASLEGTMPESVTWTRPRGGLSLLVSLPEGLDSAELLPEAARAGVLYSPGRMFFVGDGARHLRLSFGNVATGDVEEGARRLAGVLEAALARGTRYPRRVEGIALPPV
jgi:2-aminoadipate transaminase